jgi:hypothetical protein
MRQRIVAFFLPTPRHATLCKNTPTNIYIFIVFYTSCFYKAHSETEDALSELFICHAEAPDFLQKSLAKPIS